MSLRVGIVGCGKIAEAHIEQIRAIGGADVVAACDLERLMARQLAVRFSIPAHYGDLAEMLEREKLDVVHITTPPNSHPSIVEQATAAGCHVFVEKPFALDLAGARAIVDAAERRRRKLSINYWYNFDPPTEALRELIAAGTLGDTVHVESVLGYDLSGAYGTAVLGDADHWVHRLPGKLFHNVLDHVLSKITLVLPDSEPTIAVMDYRRREPSNNAVIDLVADELRFLLGGRKVSAYGMISGYAKPVAHSLRVLGTKNSVTINYQSRTVTLDTDQVFPTALGRLPMAWQQAKQFKKAGRRNLAQFMRYDFHYFQGMRRLLQLFYESIRSDGPPPIPYEQILRVSALIDGLVANMQQTKLQHELATVQR
jgi:predicted dehydrogenase